MINMYPNGKTFKVKKLFVYILKLRVYFFISSFSQFFVSKLNYKENSTKSW